MKNVETLKLMSVRAPQLNPIKPSNYITPSVFEELSPEQREDLEEEHLLLYFELQNAMDENYKISLNTAKTKVEAFQLSPNYSAHLSKFVNNSAMYLSVFNMIKDLGPDAEMDDALNRITEIFGEPLADIWPNIMEARIYSWENLFAQHILGSNSEALELLILGQKVLYFMGLLFDNIEDTDYDVYGAAQLTIHSKIKVHYSIDLPLAEKDADPENEENEEGDRSSITFKSIELLMDLRYKLVLIYDQKLTRYRKISSMKGEDTPPEITVFDYEFFDFSDLDEVELNVLESAGIDTSEEYTYDELSRRIEMAISASMPMLAQRANKGDRMVIIGNSLVNADKLCAHLANRDLCKRYLGPTLPQGKGNIMPIGVADLKVLETSLYKYELGEIAHIENVLKGEKKERTFRDLNRTEESFTTEEENQSEKVRDTQTTERFEMQKEVSNVLSQESSFDAGLSVSASYGGVVSITAGTNYATSSSQQQSDSASQSYAKEITEKALDRVIKRVRTQQTITRLHETEETNMHGIDNADSPTDNIAGVYRWVNKVYYNKIKNYGKRLMFELIVPEPAAFFIYSKLVGGSEKVAISPPLNPMVGSQFPYTAITGPTSLNAGNYFLWTALYDVQDTTPPPAQFMNVNRAFNIQRVASTSEIADGSGNPVGNNLDFNAQTQVSNDIEIPEGYVGKLVKIITLKSWQSHDYSDIQLTIADQWRPYSNPWPVVLNNLTGKVPVGILSRNCFGTVNLIVDCEVSNETMRNWQIKTYDAIMRGYNRKLEEYNAELRSMQTREGIVIKGDNPLKNRETEKEELKKASISIITGQRFEAFDALVGADPANPNYRYPEFNFAEAKAEGRYIQYFEQVFDWKNMTYQFYPYFWGRKPNWLEAKSITDNDPVFEKFLQAGAARILVPVTLGYENSVMHYLQTGVIWNGSESIVTNDPYLENIFEDLAEETEDDSEAWLTTVPTNLVYLQSLDTVPPLPDNSGDFTL